ncbi:MAG: T9SS type A sorting domain-containing protein [Bacteroidota bacterium]
MRRYHQLIFAFLFFLHVQVQAQNWQRSFPGTDIIEGTVLEMPDGGFLATRSNGAAVFKTDAGGALLWTWQPTGMTNAVGYDLSASPDGNYYATGQRVVNNQSEYFLSKISGAGQELWTKIFPPLSVGSGRMLVRAVPGGGIYVSWEYNVLMKLDDSGNVIWQKNSIQFSVGDLVPTADGGAFFLVNPNTTSDPRAFVYKIDASGTNLNLFIYNDTGLAGRSMCATADGGFAITGLADSPYDCFLLKADANGTQQWLQRIGDPVRNDIGLSVKQTPAGGYLIAGWDAYDNRYIHLFGLDNLGNLAFERGYGNGEGIDVQPLTNGGIVLLARNFTVNGVQLIRTGPQGELFQNKIQGKLIDDQNLDCSSQNGEPGLANWTVKARGTITQVAITDSAGNYALDVDTGKYKVTLQPPTSTWQPCQPYFQAVFSGTAQTQTLPDWTLQAVTQSHGTVTGVIFQDLDGDCEMDPDEPLLSNYPVVGETEGGGNMTTVYSDSTGHYTLPMPAFNYVNVYMPNSPQNPYCTPCCANSCYFGVLEFDTIVKNLGVHCTIPAPQLLQGAVFYDENKNCVQDPDEPLLSAGWTVTAVKKGTTDTLQIDASLLGNGHFASTVDTGTYFVSISPPNYLFLPCQAIQMVQVNLGNPGGATVDFALMPLSFCPYMRVDIGTPSLRICQDNRYFVHYCNEGTDDAADAFVRITLPPELTLTSSDIPGVQQPGNVWEFDLGGVPKGFCGDFGFKAVLDCNSPLGATHCVEAHIFPDSICGPLSASWDGSSVQLHANCFGDSLVLSITNMGWGDMQKPLEFIVVEDNVLIKADSFQLHSGESSFVTVYPNGATILLQAQQAPYHPGKSMPVIMVEGCGGNPISLGFVVQYPQDDADHFISIDCHEGINAFDPNHKSAQPEGVTEAHYIQPTTDLNYEITFQNLGNGTASNVVLLDTLSSALDIVGLEPGASSFPYQLSIDKGVLRFAFNNINLPHAAANEPGSIGFVKFRVHQKAGNKPGTVIQNRAGIYFDQNPVVMTNTVTHRIPAPKLFDYQATSICHNADFQGQHLQHDTVINQRQRFAFFDSIHVWSVHVLPLFALSIDTTVMPGSLLFGVQVWADTVFTAQFTDVDGCLAQAFVQARITTRTGEPGVLQMLSIQPNPAGAWFSVRLRLSEAAIGSGRILDVYGRTVLQLFENETITSNFEKRVNPDGLPAGIYWVEIRVGGERRVKKLVLNNE